MVNRTLNSREEVSDHPVKRLKGKKEPNLFREVADTHSFIYCIL